MKRFFYFSYPLDNALAEEALRPHQEDEERQYIGEPVLDAAAEIRAEIDFGELFAGADDEAADDRAGHRGQPAEHQHRQRLQRDERDRELHAELGAPDDPGGERDEPRHRPDDNPDLPERDADRLRRL